MSLKIMNFTDFQNIVSSERLQRYLDACNGPS